MKTKQPLHERLRRARRAANIIQAHVALALDVSQSTVSNWEKGIQKPNSEQLAGLRRLYRHYRADAALKAARGGA